MAIVGSRAHKLIVVHKGRSLILVVDDNVAGRMLVRAALTLAESHIDITGSAEAVLKRLSSNATDAIRSRGVENLPTSLN